MLRSKFFRMFRTGVIFAVFFACLSSANAQTWKQIGNLPPGTDLRCAYFWDANNGVVGGVNCIYTFSFGVWKVSSYPEEPDTIKSLRLLDGHNLYAACGVTCVWESTDRGMTWQKTNALLHFADDINVGADGLIHGVNLMGTGMSIGTTIARTNPRISDSCIVARDDDNSVGWSSDGGVTWFSSKPPYFDCGYTCAVDTCSEMCYTISDGPKVELYRSTDRGMTWNLEYDFGTGTASDIFEGANSGVMYVQGPKNVWRSLSGGSSWQSIGGPASALDDRRMFAFGQYNRYLVEMDSGVVWLWDGGAKAYPTGPATRVLDVSNVVDTDCTFPRLIVSVTGGNSPDTIRIHAFAEDSSTIQPEDTTIILPAGTGTVPIQYRTFVPPLHFSATFYFEDTIVGTFECGQYQYAESDSVVVQLPSYPTNILSVSDITDTGCSISHLTVYFAQTTNPDTVRIHAYTNDGLLIQPADTTLIIPAGNGMIPVQYRASAHPFQFASTFYFEDTVSGEYKCGQYKYVTDSSISVHLFPPPGTPRCWLKTPFKFDACTNTRIPLVIRAPDICDSLTIDSITWSDSTLTPMLDPQPQLTLGPDGLDTFWVTLFAPTPGIYNNYFYIHTTSVVVPKPWDTTLYLYALASGSPTNPRASAPAKLTLSNCGEAAVPLYLHALACDSVEFTGCTLSMGNSIKYSTNFNFPLSLASGMSDTFSISFPPQGLSGITIVSAEIKGKYLGTTITFDTIVKIQVTFTNAASALLPNVDGVNFNSFSLCTQSESDTTVTFTNFGCDTLTVTGDQTVWQNGWSANDPSFPFPLPPKDSFSVLIHFKPTAFTFSNQTMTYGFEYEGGKDGTVQLGLTGEATPANVSLALTDTALNFGTFSQCGNPVGDTTIIFTNTGCDSLALSGASVDVGNGFTLVSGNDTTLAPNGSASFAISFADSVPGTFNSAFHITGIGADGETTIDTSVSLTAAITAGTRLAAINITAIDFGTTSICEERDSSLTITNKGCEADTILSGSFSSSQFAFDSMFSFPIIIPEDSEVTFPVFTHLDTTGHPATISGTLNFTLASGLTLPSVALTRSINYPGAFSLSLAAEASAPIKAMVPVYVLRNGTVPAQANEVDFDLVYNDDLLGYNNAVQPDITYIGQTQLANGLLDRSFRMSPASDRDTIATLQFQTYLTKNTSTGIQLTHQQFVAAGVVSPPCVATMDTVSVPSNFTLELVCADSLILAAWNDSLPFVVESIQPNPAQNEITATLSGTVQPKIEIYNALGQLITIPPPSSLNVSASSAMRPSSLSLDVSDVPSGMYYLRFSSDGYVQTRSISIER